MDSKSRWNAQRQGLMTEAAIRAIHSAPKKARVSKYVYGPHEQVVGKSKRCTAYVLSGQCELFSQECRNSFVAEDVFLFRGGDYMLRAGADGAVVVWAWEFPPGFTSD